MTNTEMRTELLERAQRLEEAATRCRKAAAILTVPGEDDKPMNGNGYGKYPVVATHTNGKIAHPVYRVSPRRDRIVKALRKHGPMSPSNFCAYAGIARSALSAYAFQWIKTGHVKWNEKDFRYELGPAA